MIEHLQHNGYENGYLMATYDQLVDFGIGRRFVRKTIDQAERLGLIEVERLPRRTFTESYPSRFRLTFLPDKVVNEKGKIYYGEPTNEWRQITDDMAVEIRKLEKQNSMVRR